MKLINSILLIFFFTIISSKVKGAESIFLYKGTFNRTIEINELTKFKKTKIPSKKLKSLIKITNQNKDELYKLLSYEIDVPLSTSSKLMNSKIGEVFLSRISKIIHPNKVKNVNIGTKAIRAGIILSSHKNNQKINLIDFLKAYPNKNIAINLNALSKASKKVESLKELIDFYTNSPLKKLKDGRSSN